MIIGCCSFNRVLVLIKKDAVVSLAALAWGKSTASRSKEE
jgi:hypothetical protein